jgi:putative ATPase
MTSHGETLFDDREQADRANAPLAVRMRPTTIAEVVGQSAALADGSPLRSLLTGGVRGAVSVVLWGPPGTGKTTLATLVSRESGRVFTELSAVTAGVKDVRRVIDEARERLRLQEIGTVLFVDEVHRFSKSQQDALLPAVENGWVTLIAATTENPSFSVIAPLLSRSIVVTLQPLTDAEVEQVLRRAVHHERGLAGTVEVTDDAIAFLVRTSGGDARRGLTALDAASSTGAALIDLKTVESAVQHAAVRYDRDGDQHYDVISAFIKSVRGSDPDAALHYLARMLEAGEDPRFVARRLVILASEDIGMADPSVLQTATAAAHSVAMIGMPEARIVLAQATVHAALAPKSNSVYRGIDAAIADVRAGRIGTVPAHLRDAHYPGAAALGHGQDYIYPHDVPGGVAEAEYLPEALRGVTYYQPTEHGAEARWADIARRLQERRRGESTDA